MKNNKILLIGGGGHCHSVLDSLLQLDVYSDIGIVDTKENIGKSILSNEIIGTDDDLYNLYKEGYKDAFVTVGSIGNTELRRRLFHLIEMVGYNIPNIIDPSSVVSVNARLGNGIFIGKNVTINTGVEINEGAIINTGSIIEHDCKINKFVHISPGVVLCGDVIIGENTHIGANSIVKQQVSIERDSIIGMGSVVLNNIAENSIAYGNPCKLKSNKSKREL